MSTRSALVLGLGLGVLAMSPVIGVAAVVLADVITDWHQRRGACV